MACPCTAASIWLAANQGRGLPHVLPRGRSRSTNESDLSHSSSSSYGYGRGGGGGDGEGAAVRKAATTGRQGDMARTRGSPNILEGGTCMSSARVGAAGSGHPSFEADGWMAGVKGEAVGRRSGRGSGRHGMRLRRVAWGGSGGDVRSRSRSRSRLRSPSCYQAEATAISDANATMTEPRVRHGQGVEEREQGLPRTDQSQVRTCDTCQSQAWDVLGLGKALGRTGEGVGKGVGKGSGFYYIYIKPA